MPVLLTTARMRSILIPCTDISVNFPPVLSIWTQLYGAGTGNGTRLVAVAKKAFYNNAIEAFFRAFSRFFVGDRMFFFENGVGSVWLRARMSRSRCQARKFTGV